jgi:GGDEF domain-containing protein
MRTLARAAAGSLALLCAALALVAVAVAVLGIAGTRSAASQGNVIADDELTTAVVTGQLARDLDAAYAAGQAAVLATDEAERARLLGTLYTSLLPAVDARLFALERLHAGSVLLSRPAPYSEAEEHRIRESVGQAAPVLANLRNLAVAEIRAATDGLTGLPNKRAVTDALKRTFAQAATTQAPLALLLLDLDHFKQVNDQRGHAVGDQVLAAVGATLRGVLRARDFAGRNGGEEFAVLLPDTEIGAALEIAGRVRASYPSA